MMRKTPHLLVLLMILFGSCSHNKSQDNEYSEEIPEYFPTADITMVPDLNEKRIKIGEMKYFVNGDTLFTSELFHSVGLGYSNDSDEDFSYLYMVFMSQDQQRDSRGWYHVTFGDVSIPRVPETHLSLVVMLTYSGPLKSHNHGDPSADAMLYNITEIYKFGQDKDTLSSELKKLLPNIR